MSALFRLENRIQPYAWGSRSALATLRGAEAPTATPEAELWMGAHPLAPSRVVDADGNRSLIDLIESDTQASLGTRVSTRFGQLPFLLKVLAAAQPLSLQAHPDEAQARLGFASEDTAGIPLDAPRRTYKDPHHKPELIVALTPFSALAGFRKPSETRRLLSGLGVPSLAPIISALTERPEAPALQALFEKVTGAPPLSRQALADGVLAACRTQVSALPDFERELAWGVRIGELYPGDAGIVLALALNLVVLEPGQALYLPAGNLHSYLEGTGVEIMASSDNVLRGGLTQKHVDAPELLRVLNFQAEDVALVPTRQDGEELHYVTPASEFALSRLTLRGARVPIASVTGPEIIAITEGYVELRRNGEVLSLPSGASAFLPATGGPYELNGTGTVFRARVNDA